MWSKFFQAFFFLPSWFLQEQQQGSLPRRVSATCIRRTGWVGSGGGGMEEG